MKAVMVGIARMNSTRLPGKVMMPLDDIPVINWVVNAGRVALSNKGVIIATTTDPRDDEIVRWCRENAVAFYRGSENDVLERFTLAAQLAGADIAVRVTCDCPFVDPNVIQQVVRLLIATGADYAGNVDPPTYPDGLDCEAITVKALQRSMQETARLSDRECVTQYILRNQDKFHVEALTCPLPGMHKERWVLDTKEDYEFCQKIAENLDTCLPSMTDILNILDKHPEWRQINAMHPRNERFFETLEREEPVVERKFLKSWDFLSDSRNLIPLGAQTYSKSHLQYPQRAPLFVTHGDGGEVFDVDGNRYVDLVGALLPNILGYRDPDVDWAIRRQLSKGISFSLATKLERELAERLVRLIPCAEMARFGKSGTDVTTAAVRLARAYTGRALVMSSGYHGWADWSVAHDPVRNRGVPLAISRTMDTFTYGSDIGSALRTRDYACVIVEPETNPEYLRHLRQWCDETGTVLIFDEVITGFRFHLGGAQALYGVTPDLACFGKAMGNGMPISALVGKKSIMEWMEKISYSGTMFGETLSIAAAIATIDKLQRERVLPELLSKSAMLRNQAKDLAIAVGLTEHIDFLNGPLTRLWFASQDIKTLFMQEMIARGALIVASHNLCYAHTESQMRRVLAAYDGTFEVLSRAIREDNVKDMIVGAAIPSFADVRSLS